MDLIYFAKKLDLTDLGKVKEFDKISSLLDFKTNNIKHSLDFFRINQKVLTGEKNLIDFLTMQKSIKREEH